MVQIGEISFCDKIGFNIKSDETKKYILEQLEHNYNLKIITKHFDKFEERMMPNLNNNPYLMCLRSNGNPYFLYLTKLNFVNYCIFIDKKIQQGYFYPRMIIINYQFDESLFSDTIMDGEMIKINGEKWVFMINDIMVYKGNHLHSQNLVKRVNIVYQLLKTEFTPDIMDISRIQVKKYFKYDEFEIMINEHLPKLQYTCRGLYFKPLFLRFRVVLVNFNDELVKRVERQKFKNVKNFLLMEDNSEIEKVIEAAKAEPLEFNNNNKFFVKKTNTPDVYELYDNNNNMIDVACVPTLKLSKYMREFFATKTIIEKIEMQFEFSKKFNKWMPIIS